MPKRGWWRRMLVSMPGWGRISKFLPWLLFLPVGRCAEGVLAVLPGDSVFSRAAAGFSAGGGFAFGGDRPGFCRYSGAMAGQVRGLRHLPGNFADQLVCPGADVVAQLLLVEEVGWAHDDSERRARTLLGSIPDPAWLRDRDGRFPAVNDAYLALCGRPREQLFGCLLEEAWSVWRVAAFHYRDGEVLAADDRRGGSSSWL